MKALIKKAHKVYGQQARGSKINEWLEENSGQWVEIDTAHLFNDQYNTVDGFRIFDSYIDAIEDDERTNKGKCKYCGTMLNRGEECTKYTPEKPSIFGGKVMGDCSQYGVNWFTPENTYFLKFPNGFINIKPLSAEIENYSIYDVNGKFYRISRRSNLEFFVKNGEVFMYSDIGHKPMKNARLSANERRLINKAVKEFNL
jgi:hypothetical protein